MKKTMRILLVEDDPGDVMLTKKMFENVQATLQLHVVGDGVEAMAYLRREPPYTEAPRPDLVLLDLNTPKKNGCEVLQEMKSDAGLQAIPVVVLTTSNHEMDVNNAYRLGANSYIAKPTGLEALAQTIESIENFWFKTVTLPMN
jgi:two-component system, chemotaxis family, response regulator Rcp1